MCCVALEYVDEDQEKYLSENNHKRCGILSNSDDQPSTSGTKARIINGKAFDEWYPWMVQVEAYNPISIHDSNSTKTGGVIITAIIHLCIGNLAMLFFKYVVYIYIYIYIYCSVIILTTTTYV